MRMPEVKFHVAMSKHLFREDVWSRVTTARRAARATLSHGKKSTLHYFHGQYRKSGNEEYVKRK